MRNRALSCTHHTAPRVYSQNSCAGCCGPCDHSSNSTAADAERREFSLPVHRHGSGNRRASYLPTIFSYLILEEVLFLWPAAPRCKPEHLAVKSPRERRKQKR